MFEDFEFNILNDKNFKEDAVREEIINPILKGLGYKAFGANKIIYNKILRHPFVRIGRNKREIINTLGSLMQKLLMKKLL